MIVCMTSSHLNVILLFLSDCGILQFTQSPRSEFTYLLTYCSFINYNVDEISDIGGVEGKSRSP